MTFKHFVTGLAAVALCCLVLEGTSQATSTAGSRAILLTTLKKASLKFVTSHKVWKGRDSIKLTVEGLGLNPGDELALELVSDKNVPIGDPTSGDVLIMAGKPGGRLKAKGQLGTFPNTFLKCTASFSPRKGKLTLNCMKGTVIELPVDATVSGSGAFTFPYTLTVIIYVNGSPIPFTGEFRVKFSNRPRGPLIEKMDLNQAVTPSFT